MLAFDTVLYSILAWYADQVFPSEFGTTKPFYFPFQPSYWRSFFVKPNRGSDIFYGSVTPTPNLPLLSIGITFMFVVIALQMKKPVC